MRTSIGRTIIAVGIITVALGACGSDSKSADTTAEPASTAVRTTAATTEEKPATTKAVTTSAKATTTTEAATTTTAAPECVVGAGENRNVAAESYDHYVCRDGKWQFEKTVAVTTTTEPAPTTEAPPTTVGSNAADLRVLNAVVGANDPASKLHEALIDAFENDLHWERLNAISATLPPDGSVGEPAWLVIEGSSGYGTDEYQIKAASDAVAYLSDLWGSDSFGPAVKIPLAVDMTLDGNHWRFAPETLIAVDQRTMTPDEALFVSGV